MTLSRLRPTASTPLTVLALVLGMLVVAPSAAHAADPVQVQMTLEGCKLPDLATSCVYPDDFTTGSLGKNWAELDLVPHHLTLTNNDGAQTFRIRLSADHLLNGVKGYDHFTTPTVSGSGCSMTVVAANVVSPTGVVGGVDKVLTDLLEVTMADGATCHVSWAERLALGSHLYSGASLQSQVLEEDYDSIGQRTVSIPVNEIAPQEISKTAAAFSTPNYTWTVDKSSPAESVDLDSCLAAPTEPNVSYTVTYTRTKHAGTTLTVSGSITLTNPANRSLVASVTDTVKLDGSPVGGGTLPDVTVPANGSAVIPYSFPVGNGDGTLTNTASAVYHDPDNPDVDLTPLSTTVAVPISPQELPGTNASATLTDTETASSGLLYSRTSPHPTSGFVSTDSFQESLSGSGSFGISKIVKSAAPGNFDGTLLNEVSLDPDGDGAPVTASVSIPIHVTAAQPRLTLNKHVDVAPAADATFTFTVTNDQTDAETAASVTILAGQTSGSTTVTVAPSNAGYTVAEGTPPTGYDAAPNAHAEALALCGSGSIRVDDQRSRAALTVTKAISGDDPPPEGFVFAVSCDDGTTATLTFHAAGSRTVDGILTGAVCDVTETPVDGWTSSPSGPQQVTITTEGATVAFTNTRNVGSVSVTKAIEGDVAPADGFVFSVSCTDGTEETLTFHAAGTQTVDGILSGSTCTVTETAVEGWTSTPAGPQEVTLDLADGATAEVSFTNVRQPASLALVKTVDKATAAYGDTLNYGFTVTNTGERPLHAAEVSDEVPDEVTYVAGSASCTAPCTASYDAATNTVHWVVGDLAPGASFGGLTYAATIDTPTPAADGAIPSETILNTGTASSPPDVESVLSNEVKTIVTAVLGVKIIKELPKTGAAVPVPQAFLLALALLIGGAGLTFGGSVLDLLRRAEEDSA